MKRILNSTACLALMLSLGVMSLGQIDPAAAGVDADLRAGLYVDADAVAWGGGVLTGVGTGDVGVNLLAGMGGVRGSVRPFAQMRGVVSDDSGIAFMGGVRFRWMAPDGGGWVRYRRVAVRASPPGPPLIGQSGRED